MSERKRLSRKIADQKNKIDRERLKADLHKKYFIRLLQDHSVILYGSIASVFLLGTKSDKIARKFKRLLKPVIKYYLVGYFRKTI